MYQTRTETYRLCFQNKSLPKQYIPFVLTDEQPTDEQPTWYYRGQWCFKSPIEFPQNGEASWHTIGIFIRYSYWLHTRLALGGAIKWFDTSKALIYMISGIFNITGKINLSRYNEATLNNVDSETLPAILSNMDYRISHSSSVWYYPKQRDMWRFLGLECGHYNYRPNMYSFEGNVSERNMVILKRG